MYFRIALACLVAAGASPRTLAQVQAPPPSSAATAAAVPSDQMLSKAQLDALVAPIALYPDVLVAQSPSKLAFRESLSTITSTGSFCLSVLNSHPSAVVQLSSTQVVTLKV